MLPAADRPLVNGTTGAARQPPHQHRLSVSGNGEAAAKIHGGHAAEVEDLG